MKITTIQLFNTQSPDDGFIPEGFTILDVVELPWGLKVIATKRRNSTLLAEGVLEKVITTYFNSNGEVTLKVFQE